MIECEESSVGAGERGTEHGKNNSNREKKNVAWGEYATVGSFY